MAQNTQPKFIFKSLAVDKDTFHVVKFKGTEGLSSIYRFNITVISQKSDLNVDDILQSTAEFTIKRDDGDIPFKGILSSFEQFQQAGGYVFYRAELVPQLWRTTLTHHNQFFLDKTVQDFLGEVLKDGGMKQGMNFDFKLKESYKPWEYVCQYDESHFNFVSRWMERNGLYYYFEQTDQGEKMVITDTHIVHTPMAEGSTMTYSPPSNLEHTHRDEVVHSFILKQQPLPQKVLLKDYNYRKPSLEIQAEAIVSPKGMGEIYLYGEHILSPDEGNKLATIRAQEFQCREKVYHGVSSIPYVRTGYIFTLKNHYSDAFNQQYLTTEVTHEGSQEAYLTAGLGLHLSKNQEKLYYRNSFSCIPTDKQFRPERLAQKPKFVGSMYAKVDASGSGQYAELDDQGRYKVILPMDTSGRKGGKATTWLRMAQPYGGSNHGMHFPLHKGTEVLLTCIDGDPDRPIIQAAVPNPETPSQVNDQSQTQCKITTGGQNRIHMEDKKGGERIVLHSPKASSWVRMGTPNDPPSQWEDIDEEEQSKVGIKLNTDEHIEVMAGSEATTIFGNKFEFVGGAVEEVTVGTNVDICLLTKEEMTAGLLTDLKMGGLLEYSPNLNVLHGEEKTFTGILRSFEIKVDEINEDLTQITNSNTTLVDEKVNLTNNYNNITESVQRLTNSQNELNESVNELTNDSNLLSATLDEIIDNHNVLCNIQNRLGNAHNILANEVGEIADSYAGIKQNVTKITGEVDNKLGSVMNVISNLQLNN